MPQNLPRIRSLTIRGFRSFGPEPQELRFDSDIAVVWGPNSHGKTSLAEAVEFLLTGQIVRRQMLASAQDEFAESLRNAHLDTSIAVTVSAEILDTSGASRVVCRTLVSDYQRRAPCTSQLQIDGTGGTQDDLAAMGFQLSQPPLEAPILTQHTLGYLFSARPQDRATYFKTVLEVTDLEDFRSALSTLVDVDIEPNELIRRLDACATQQPFQPLSTLAAEAHDRDTLNDIFTTIAGSLLTGAGIDTPESLPERINAIRGLRDHRHGQSFPLTGFGTQTPTAWEAPTDDEWQAISEFLDQLAAIDEKTRSLTTLFNTVLSLPSVSEATEAIECPVCATDGALTPDRVEHLRKKVADTEAYRAAEQAGQAAIRSISEALRRLIQGCEQLPCRALQEGHGWRVTNGFSVQAMRTLLEEDQNAVDEWLNRQTMLLRTVRGLSAQVKSTQEGLRHLSRDDGVSIDALKLSVANCAAMVGDVASAVRDAVDAEGSLKERLIPIVEEASATVGWTDFVELSLHLDELVTASADRRASEALARELRQALQQIDRGKEAVLDTRFAELSQSIKDWWDLLRPEESSFFNALMQRPGARRTIDFKAGLSRHDDQSNPVIRDAVAVFSQSQLHCLGLALFLARALREQTGLVILDEPFLASDDEHRAHFVHSAIQKLHDLGCQVVVLTQCRRTWRDLDNRYQHTGVDVFQLELDRPADGTIVTASSDGVSARLNAVKPFIRSNTAELRKRAGERLRDIAERFCKELAVRSRFAAGDTLAGITDYDGRNLGQLIPVVHPYLTDASHPGKLNAIRDGLNPANHDGGIPDRGMLTVCFGDLQRFAKDYL